MEYSNQAELHPVDFIESETLGFSPSIYSFSSKLNTGKLGLEPRTSVLETDVIPFHHSPITILPQQDSNL